jgi:TusA-related sulfurtransferase
MNKIIDCLGMRCPLPIIVSAKTIVGMKDGESFTLLSDDPATHLDLTAWSRMTGNESHAEGNNQFTITKKIRN